MHGSDGKILILGGTAEAYTLAEQLASASFTIITSLAGRTQNPRLPAGQVRIGGFGGVEGLTAYLRQEPIGLIIDATHPFARQITAHAIAAADRTGIPLLRLERPLWQRQADDNWIEVDTPEEAALAIPASARVFLAIGRQHLAAFLHRHDAGFVARMIESPETAPPFRMLHIIPGKPGEAEDEVRFFLENRVDCLVCRNSGGKGSCGKIIAARQLALPVIMINRGPPANITTATGTEEVMSYIHNHWLIK